MVKCCVGLNLQSYYNIAEFLGGDRLGHGPGTKNYKGCSNASFPVSLGRYSTEKKPRLYWLSDSYWLTEPGLQRHNWWKLIWSERKWNAPFAQVWSSLESAFALIIERSLICESTCERLWLEPCPFTVRIEWERHRESRESSGWSCLHGVSSGWPCRIECGFRRHWGLIYPRRHI